MNIFAPLCSGPEFAAFNNMTPDSLYDWRRRGIDLGLSAATNGRKEYTFYDCLEAFVLSELRRLKYDDLKYAFGLARAVTPQIARVSGLSLNGWPFPTQPAIEGRYIKVGCTGGVDWSDDLSDLALMNAPIIEVLDARQLAHLIWPRFLARMTTAFPGRDFPKE